MRAGLCFCLLWTGCLAQSQSVSFEGELTTRQLKDLSHLLVRLETSSHVTAAQTTVTMEGFFRFFSLDPGAYTLVVSDERGNEVTREPVNILSSNPRLTVELPEDPAAAPPAGAVSVAELRHQPPARALRAAVKAGKLSQAGNYRAAAAELEKAVAWDPNYAVAHANLGAQYARLHQSARAVAEFRKSVALDPSNATAEADLALTLGQLGQIPEAAQAAQHALQIDSTNPIAHYVMGCILARGKATRDQAIVHLELAARTLPPAAKALAELKAGE